MTILGVSTFEVLEAPVDVDVDVLDDVRIVVNVDEETLYELARTLTLFSRRKTPSKYVH